MVHELYIVEHTQYTRGRSKSDRKQSGYCPGGGDEAGQAAPTGQMLSQQWQVGWRLRSPGRRWSLSVCLSSDALHTGGVRFGLGLRKVHQPGVRLLHIIDRLLIRLVVRRLQPVGRRQVSSCWVDGSEWLSVE